MMKSKASGLISTLLLKIVLARRNICTGPPVNSDRAGTSLRCHCKRVSLYTIIFSKRISFCFGPREALYVHVHRNRCV